MPSDAVHAKFLYTILKQLDLKSIDWATVASQLDITNGHAARMRFSRFKQHMEGIQPSPRRRAGGYSSTSSGWGKSGGARVRKKEKDWKGKQIDVRVSAVANCEGEGEVVKTGSVFAEGATTVPPSVEYLLPEQQSFEATLGEMQAFPSPPTAVMTTADFSSAELGGALYDAYGGGQMPVLTEEIVPEEMQGYGQYGMGEMDTRAGRRAPNGAVIVKQEPWDD